jgi:hypothetical protein
VFAVALSLHAVGESTPIEMEPAEMAVRDDQPKLVVDCLGDSESFGGEHQALVEPPELGQRSSEPSSGVRRKMGKRSRRLRREVERKWHDDPPKELLRAPIIAEGDMRLTEPKGRILREALVANLDRDREGATAYLGRPRRLARHA